MQHERRGGDLLTTSERSHEKKYAKTAVGNQKEKWNFGENPKKKAFTKKGKRD